MTMEPMQAPPLTTVSLLEAMHWATSTQGLSAPGHTAAGGRGRHWLSIRRWGDIKRHILAKSRLKKAVALQLFHTPDPVLHLPPYLSYHISWARPGPQSP